ncbi:PREDICTED: zinc finger protein 91-like isoform X1 [Cyprinodon variegatus]|uniref:Zinc finger protein 91-like n=1 Tax=Cyprinodon variegatus TaxID=28743 RepID=A0A3Q2DWT7_CYPVA|nr:PREDICTED: zinc finger protein 91-like isoform X1 [Cyprinodon variegatus]
MDEPAVPLAIKDDTQSSTYNVKDDENKDRKEPADRDGLFCHLDCGEAFSEEAAYSERPHQHPPQIGSDGLLDAEKDNEKLYFCTLCSLSFTEKSELHLHMKDHVQTSLEHSDAGNPGATKQRVYECSDCGKSYTVIGHFLNHQRSHKQPSKSVFHDLEHLKKKSFQCESCGRSYSRSSALDAHRRCHEEKLVKSKNRSSGEIVQAVEPEATLSENPTVEDNENLFRCLCGKAFSNMMRLKTHQRFSRNPLCSPEELKQKPKKGCGEFHCSECNKAFNGYIALFNHQRWHTNQSDDPAKKFPCEECGKVFMTLTFYYRHQRTAHSVETPSKSFHHQVCQLQKKAYECKDCGLKFSRPSALQSHQLQHTDVFKETEKPPSEPPLQPQRISENIQKDNEQHSAEGAVEPETFPPSGMDGEQKINETDEDLESYEPGDFNVQVISPSESEDEAFQEPNPDLELLCESDQELREDGEFSPESLVSKSELDLKIVQIDLEQSSQCELIEGETLQKTAEETLDCPDCFRSFNNPSSLHVHAAWHGVRRRRQQSQCRSEAGTDCETFPCETENSLLNQAIPRLEENTYACNECSQDFAQSSALVSHQLQHHKRKQHQCQHCASSYLHATSLFNHLKICKAQKSESIFVSKKAYNPKKTLLGPKIFHCEQCGKGFWSLGAYSHHKQNEMECINLRLRRGLSGSAHSIGRNRSGIKVACPACGRKFRHKGILALHMRKHENGNHKCEICGRSFRLFSSLVRHEVVHSAQLLPPPAKSFQHQLEQLKKNTYSCPDCGKLFSRAKALQFHMKSHGYETSHSPSSAITPEAVKDLQCSTCLAHFSKKSSLRAHQKLCIKRYGKGEVKTESDASKAEFMGVDLPEPPEQITEAGGNALKMGKHQKEKDSGSNNLKYKCEICSKSFSVVGALNVHKRVHTKGCKAVEESNSDVSLFKMTKKEKQSRMNIHCLDCGRCFTTKAALGSHKRWHRNKKCSPPSLGEDVFNSVDQKTEGGGFMCEKCGKHFFNSHVLQRHRIFNPRCLTRTDPDTNTDLERDRAMEKFSCLECDQTFGQVSLLVNHLDEHRKVLETGEPSDPASEPPDGSESVPSALKIKTHQCPVCSMTFEKARGLRAHKWQAHAESKKSKNKPPQSGKVEQMALEDKVDQSEHCVNTYREIEEAKPDPQPVRSDPCLDTQTLPGSAEASLNTVCIEFKQNLETAEATDEVSSPLSRFSEPAVKYLFRCDKCGKAFQTEEHLEGHKNKAKSRPYCCALCCHGFWTENQLQQHLIWHDEVRCRLPNEVRLWLSSAETSKLLKKNFANATDGRGKLPPPSAASQPCLDSTGLSRHSCRCKLCGKAFHSPTALQKHRVQCSSMSYCCSDCPRVFSGIQECFDHQQGSPGSIHGLPGNKTSFEDPNFPNLP